MEAGLQQLGPTGMGLSMDVTLDPDTAHPNLVLSEDRKCVQHRDTRQHVPDTPERFDYCPCVLGSEGFTGGRRYWEVEVGDKTEWYVGVCRESVRRKGGITLSPGHGYWVVWLEDGGHEPCTSPWTPLPVRMHPRWVGVFLDYEGGEVSFYNVTNRSHLFTFTDTFSGTLRPFFSPGLNAGGTNVAPLTLCPLSHCALLAMVVTGPVPPSPLALTMDPVAMLVPGTELGLRLSQSQESCDP
ncbi:E3 ubiquitin-protein ligase TRIM39-like [Alligator mississippiensis]|uniref:E3 ubiquitin-protein ligase TRIM39-like n=1 Tax=Alligator mississippiensis TaxID=8496 RepID=UPI0028780BC4|nr:E3 ubiquitin-protein ligase TRIM39-like [Alligator mississippiensis]